MILDDVRVLDFTQYLAGPTVTRLMAEMGAEIIKVERAPGGDPGRTLPAIKDGRSAYFVQQNRGKQSLCLDMGIPGSEAVLLDLVRKVDVVVENYGPGVMEKRGLDYESLREINPRLIMASISAFGRRDSPLSHKTGFDWIAQAFSGLMYMTGPRGGAPHPTGVGMGDISSGVHAFAALGYALYHRERTGEGQWIDISMVDVLFAMHEVTLQAYSTSGGKFQPGRMGSHHTGVCPFGVFQGPQDYIVILALDPQWPNLCRAMQQPELEKDPRFEKGSSRMKNQDELIPIIEAWLQSFETDAEIFELLESHRVPCSPVLSPIDAIDHPYFIERGMIRSAKDPILGEVTIPGFPLRFSAQPEVPDTLAPLLGQHNGEILERVLGYSSEQITALESDGVLAHGDT